MVFDKPLFQYHEFKIKHVFNSFCWLFEIEKDWGKSSGNLDKTVVLSFQPL